MLSRPIKVLHLTHITNFNFRSLTLPGMDLLISPNHCFLSGFPGIYPQAGTPLPLKTALLHFSFLTKRTNKTEIKIKTISFRRKEHVSWIENSHLINKGFGHLTFSSLSEESGRKGVVTPNAAFPKALLKWWADNPAHTQTQLCPLHLCHRMLSDWIQHSMWTARDLLFNHPPSPTMNPRTLPGKKKILAKPLFSQNVLWTQIRFQVVVWPGWPTD